jgi:mitochondrial import inner membrane translocase subunit TIM16
VAGVGNATSGSLTDQLTRQHRMTLDEAHLILNVKRGEDMSVVLKVSYDSDPLGIVF